eukprot:1123483-Pyramimonas_sp.AAC.1
MEGVWIERELDGGGLDGGGLDGGGLDGGGLDGEFGSRAWALVHRSLPIQLTYPVGSRSGVRALTAFGTVTTRNIPC